MTVPIWIAFILLIVALVALDLGVFHRKDRVVTLRSALGWSSLWISLAMLFMVFVYLLYENNYPWSSLPTEHMNGRAAVTQFLTGYVLEYSLSLDNVFVIAMVLTYFHVPPALQHRVLFWGILGAVVLRGVMIALGVALINRFEWVTYIFGVFLLYSAARMLMLRQETVDPSDNPLIKLAQRLIPVTPDFHGHRFVVRVDGKLMATPLLLALLLVESSDVMFAVDSIPAIFAITRDPFIIFTSNIFAILGLRSLYFILAAYMRKFRYLKQALVFVLAYVGVKMIVSHHFDIPDMLSLSIIGGILLVGIMASIHGASRDPVPLKSPLDQ
jgi:tellurite resistance protein TerC